MKITTNKNINNLEHRVNMTMEFASLTALYEGLTNATSYISNIKVRGIADNYITSSLLISLSEEIFPSIKKDFCNNKYRRLQITKELSYTIGLFSSIIVTVSNYGSGYILTFGFNLLRNTTSTYLIDKLSNYGQVDGFSLAILIGFLFEIPKLSISILRKPLVETILSIISLCALFGINYKLLKNNKSIPVIFTNGKSDVISIGIANSYSTSIMASSVLMKLLEKLGVHSIVSCGVTSLLIPVLSYVLTNESEASKNISDYLQRNNGIIPMRRPGTETKKYIESVLKDVSFNHGLIGSLVFVTSYTLVNIFSLPISPMYIAMLTNCVIRVNYSIKSISTVNKTMNSGFLK